MADDADCFDWDNFYYDLEDTRSRRKMSWRQVAEQSHVTASSLTRLSQGKDLTVENLARLLIWAGLRFDSYVHSRHVEYA